MNKILCAAYVFYMTGMSVSHVGTIAKPSTSPVEWWFPLMMFAMLATPAILGYLAGKED